MRRSVLVVLVALVACVPVSAHKFHASLAEVDYNAKSGSAEIAIRMFVDDLEDAVSRSAGRRVRIDTTADFDRYALAYVQSALKITDRDGHELQLAWVGKDASVDEVWVYVEAPAPSGLDGARLSNKIFFDLFDDQVNTVIVKRNGAKSTVVFKPGDGEKTIPEPDRAP